MIAPILLLLASAAPAQEPDPFRQSVRPLLEAACLECHAGAEAKGGVDLAAFGDEAAALEQASLWPLVSELLEFEEMPPPGQPRPDPALLAAAGPWLRAREAAPEEGPAAPTLRRLNRREVAGCLEAAFGISAPVERLLPEDPVGHGYDTAAGVQAWTSERLDASLALAEWVAERVFPAPLPGRPGPLARVEGAELGAPQGRPRRQATRGSVLVPLDVPSSGRWRLRVRAHGDQAGPDPVRVRLHLGPRRSAERELWATSAEPEVLAFDAFLERGRRRVGVEFTNDWYDRELRGKGAFDRNLAVHWIELVGPLEPPAPSALQRELEGRHRRGTAAERRAAMLAELATELWRRPVEPQEVAPFAALAPAEAPLAEALQAGLAGLLCSPHFWFLVEPAPAQGGALDGHALAARLSLFLWARSPDAELRALAASGELLEPGVLRAQAERLLADPRAEGLVRGFVPQWLGLTGLAAHRPDPQRFPGYDAELGRSMVAEARDLFADLLRRDGPLVDLVAADYTFVDERLARHYGLPPEALAGEPGPGRAVRASLAGTPRRGLVGQAGVLTITSDPARTSPVLRGKWLLETLLGTPPPPPPPGVGSLPEEGEAAQGTLRERLEAHRQDPSCAACHAGMDPLGFGLEGFDAVGAERRAAPGEQLVLDDFGELPDGRSFQGALELVQLLAAEPGLARTLGRELLTYALGRAPSAAERRALEADLAANPPLGLRGLVLLVLAQPAFSLPAPAPAH